MAAAWCRRACAGRGITRSRGTLQSAPGTGFRLMGGTLIRHATGSGAVPAVSLGVHGAATGCCLMPSAGFPLVVTAGVMSAALRTVNLASVAPSTDKNLRTAERTQKHPKGVFINTSRGTCPARSIAENYTTFYRPHLGGDQQRLGVVFIASGHHRISGRHSDPAKSGQRPHPRQHRPRSANRQRGMFGGQNQSVRRCAPDRRGFRQPSTARPNSSGQAASRRAPIGRGSRHLSANLATRVRGAPQRRLILSSGRHRSDRRCGTISMT